MQTTCEHLRPVLSERLAAQALLATAFQSVFGCEPSLAQVAALSDPATSEAFRVLGLQGGDAFQDDGDASAFHALLRDASAGAIERLRAEYLRLLIGPARLPAPPWESAYRGEDRLLLQASTLKVRALYRSRGFLPARYPTVADDHVALELAFLARLSQEALRMAQAEGADAPPDGAAWESLERDMASIVDEHLLAWLPAFSRSLTVDDPSGYYAVSGRLLVRFVRSCSARLHGQTLLERG